ncbi:MAG: GGDEF domain-containing protein [Candidatus Competibacteraceae bacterium]
MSASLDRSAGPYAALCGSNLFQNVPPGFIDRCLRECEQRHLAAGEILLAPSRRNQHIYVVLSGCFSVHLDSLDNLPLVFLETGDCIGEISLLDQQNPSTFVVASEAAVVLAIPCRIVWTLLEEIPQIARNLLYILAQRVRYDHAIILAREQHAYIDRLTGLHNRRWLEMTYARVQKRLQFDQCSLCLVMSDVDHFKSVNDRYGHLVGDKVLYAVAQALINLMRPNDMIARFGGEEFIVLLPDVELAGAMTVAERLRAGIARMTLESEGLTAGLSITVSLGVAEMLPDEALEALVARADAALYRAKAGGRNRVAI